MSESYITPTLLIGVGGTGLRISERIFAMAKASGTNLGERIGALAFDTDLRDINKVRSINKRNVLQFSSPESVYELLERNRDVEETWHVPRETLPSEILNMNLVAGAAQLRMLTRLALHDTFNNPSFLRTVTSEIQSIAANDGREKFGGFINILVVGSLAGATGSGSFYQIALVLRQLCKAEGIAANVQGLFLLPDVYAKTQLPSEQIENVRANAYASIKELNAINVKATRKERDANFSYEPRPGYPLQPDEMPFSSVTFIDYENVRGGNLGRSLDSYTNMAARAGYLMVFSPLGPQQSAIAVNDARSRLDASFAGTHNIYSSIGVSSLQYPVESMQAYLRDSLVADNITGDWLKLDELFGKRVRRYNELKDQSVATEEEPRIEKAYLEDLDTLAKEEEIFFFKQVRSELFPMVAEEEGDIPEENPLHKQYIEAFLTHTRNGFWSTSELDGLEKPIMMDSSSFRSMDRVEDTVRTSENRLNTTLAALESAAKSEPDRIFETTMTAADDVAPSELKLHHLQRYIVKDGPHPVRTRAFLFLLKAEIAKQRGELNPKAARDAVFAKARVFDPTRRPDESQRSSPAIFEQAMEAASEGAFSKLVSKKGRAFVERYVNYYNASERELRSYAEITIKARTLDNLAKEVDRLIGVYNGLFSEIDLIAKGLRKNILDEENRYSETSSAADGVLYVNANAACKRATWSRVRESAAMVRFDEVVNAELSGALFDMYKDLRGKQKTASFTELGDLFREKVVDEFAGKAVAENYASYYDFSVIRAVQAEAEVVGADKWEDYLKDKVDLVAAQSRPFSTLTRPETDGQKVQFWTINPKIKEEITSSALYEDLFKFRQEDNPVEEDDFPVTVLNCVNFRLNLELTQFLKFSAGDGNSSVNAVREGIYAKSYRTLIEKMVAQGIGRGGRAGQITPHVDREWHKPLVLPELSPDADVALRERASRALLVAHTMGLLKLKHVEGREVAEFTTVGKGEYVSSHTEVIGKTHNFLDVATEFSTRPTAIQMTLEYWDNLLAVQDRQGEDSPVWKALTSVEPLVPISKIAIRRSADGASDLLARQNLIGWARVLMEYINAQRTDLSEIGRQDIALAQIARIREELHAVLAETITRPETVDEMMTNFDIARDSLVSSFNA